MCRLCGREACAECYVTVSDLTTDRPGANHTEAAALQARREKHAHNNPFFLACTRRNEHQAKDFSPMSRFCAHELEKAIADMEELWTDETGRDGGGVAKISNGVGVEAQVVEGVTATSPQNEHDLTQHTDLVLSRTLHASLNLPSTPSVSNRAIPYSDDPWIPTNLSGAILETPTLLLQRYTDNALTEENFPAIWAKGQPLVVTDLLSKFKIDWTPEYFLEKYGQQGCLIIECQTDENKRITVGEFFRGFGRYDRRAECWKLKVSLGFLFVYFLFNLSGNFRIGLLRQISRRLSQSYMRISVRQYPSLAMYDGMECSILLRIFPGILSLLTLVCLL